MPVSSQQGLRNITGAICYRLSLLQALLHQPLFVHWIQDYHRPDHCKCTYHLATFSIAYTLEVFRMTRRSVLRAVCDCLPWSIGEIPGTLPGSRRYSGGWMSFLRRWAGLLTVHPAMPIQTSRPPGFSGSCNAKYHQRKLQFSLHLNR